MKPAQLLVQALLESDPPLGRRIEVRRDPSSPKYFQIPLPASSSKSNVNLFRPRTANPTRELKTRLRSLVLNRKGYEVGDTFFTPYGNFAVTDTLNVKEV